MDQDDPDHTVVHDEQGQPPQQPGAAVGGTIAPPAAEDGDGSNSGPPGAAGRWIDFLQQWILNGFRKKTNGNK